MRVTLNEANHTYSDERGQKYKSVSSIIAEYKQPFDPYKLNDDGSTLIGRYTQKNGYTEQYWLDKWAEKRDYACEKGHAFHSLKEMFIMNRSFIKESNRMMPVQNINLQWREPRFSGLFGQLRPGVYTELCIWNYKARTSGTADKVIIYEDRTFDILDYKTNGEFKVDSFQGRCMKFPCRHLPDCHLGHYTLQLNLYAWMLAEYGLTPRNLTVEHYSIPDEEVSKIINEGILPNIEPTIHEIDYDEEMAVAVINQQKLRLNKWAA